MLVSAGIHEEVIGQHSGLDLISSHAQQPWSHEEGDKGHRERAALRDGAPVLVGSA